MIDRSASPRYHAPAQRVKRTCGASERTCIRFSKPCVNSNQALIDGRAVPITGSHVAGHFQTLKESNHVIHPHDAGARPAPCRRHVCGFRRRGAAAGARVEPPRSAVHRHRAQSRRHRLLHVQQLRTGTRRLRDAARQLPAAAVALRRTELLQDGPERLVRDPHRQQRRCERRHHVPVPLQEQAEQHHLADRRCRCGHSPDAGRHCHCAEFAQSECERDIHGRRAAWRPAHRLAPGGDEYCGWLGHLQ